MKRLLQSREAVSVAILATLYIERRVAGVRDNDWLTLIGVVGILAGAKSLVGVAPRFYPGAIRKQALPRDLGLILAISATVVLLVSAVGWASRMLDPEVRYEHHGARMRFDRLTGQYEWCSGFGAGWIALSDSEYRTMVREIMPLR